MDFFHSEEVNKVAVLKLWNHQGSLLTRRTGQQDREGRTGHKFSERHPILPSKTNKTMTHTHWNVTSPKSKGQKRVDGFIALRTVEQLDEPSQLTYSLVAVELKNLNI